MITDIIFYSLAAIVSCVGLVGVFLPMFPGVPLVFVGILIAAIVSRFGFVSNFTIVLLGFLALMSLAIDYFSGIIGAKYSGAGIFGSIGAVVGAVFGVMLLGPIGVVLGPALGVLIFELLSKKAIKASARSATYTVISTVVGMVVNLCIAVTMIVIFIGSIFV